MPLNLSTIQPARGAKHSRKRVGRGNASGHGTYSCRGLKGQKSRKGVSNLKRLGMRQVLLRTPKSRGFRSFKPRAQAVNIVDLNAYFRDGAVITPGALQRCGLITTATEPVKILGKGVLAIKNITLRNLRISESVRGQIEKQGGKIE